MEERMDQKFNALIGVLYDEDDMFNMIMLCGLIDWIAGKQGKKGYELIEELTPALHEVGDQFGVMK